MWVDATSAAGYIFNPKESQVADKTWLRAGADRGDQQRLGLVLGLGARHPGLLEEGRRRQVVREVGDLEGLRRRWSASEVGWVSAPPGTRKSTYDNPEYQRRRRSRRWSTKSVANADITKPTKDPVPYVGIQYVAIPEFQGIGTTVGQQIAAALAGQVDRRPGARDGAALDRADHEAGRLPEVEPSVSRRAGGPTANSPPAVAIEPRATADGEHDHGRPLRLRPCATAAGAASATSTPCPSSHPRSSSCSCG